MEAQTNALQMESLMKKSIVLALAIAAGALAPVAAQAGNVYWSIGINAPPIGTVISNAPVYGQPAPVVYSAPVYYPAPVYLPPVVYRPAPVVVAPSYVVGGWQRVDYYPRDWHHWNYEQRRHWEESARERGEWRHDHRDHQDGYGDRHGEQRWAPVPADSRRYRHD